MTIELLCVSYRGTLEVTESRQYRIHGLILVSHQFCESALELEQKRMNARNRRMLKVHGDKLQEVVEAGLPNDQGFSLTCRHLSDIMVRYNKVKIICRILQLQYNKEQYDYFFTSPFLFYL